MLIQLSNRNSFHVRITKTGDKWCVFIRGMIYALFVGAIEEWRHSVCTAWVSKSSSNCTIGLLELRWRRLSTNKIEFCRLNLKLHRNEASVSWSKLVDEKQRNMVGWSGRDWPTISGFASSWFIQLYLSVNCCESYCVDKNSDSTVDVGMLEHAIREDLDASGKFAPFGCGWIPIQKLPWPNYPEGKEGNLTRWVNHPEKNEEAGTRQVPFS